MTGAPGEYIAVVERKLAGGLRTPMKITIDIPDRLLDSLCQEFGQDAAQAVKEAIAVAWYQAEKLSIGQVAELLETSINEANGLMKRWHVESTFSLEDFERDRATLKRLLGPS